MYKCKKQNKVMFWSQKRAEKYALKSKEKFGDEMRVYLCESCHCWHLATEPKSPDEKWSP